MADQFLEMRHGAVVDDLATRETHLRGVTLSARVMSGRTARSIHALMTGEPLGPQRHETVIRLTSVWHSSAPYVLEHMPIPKVIVIVHTMGLEEARPMERGCHRRLERVAHSRHSFERLDA